MKTVATLLSGLFLAAGAHAEVTINIPDNVQVLAVNAEKPDLEGGLFSSTKSITLANGENQVVFRYTPYFSQGNDRVIVESTPVITKFTANNQQLSLDLPEYRNEREAEKQIKAWQVTLIDQQNQPIALTQDVLHKDGMQIGRDFVQESKEYNRTNGVAALNSGSAVAVTLPANVKVDANTAEEMLHFWYQKADAETKAKFKQYINQQ
ncbi:hypothetical protein BIY21_06160 [Vibrio ponticus]|uniref:UPF0319 protein BIY21_06160 n=1 Tax=Vibrio ponticus TaxID=265668 RepID=A0ABX3FRY0_9VIBR|nr:DUF2057 family protein [Vibrio ponticus]OLQ95551.1 hypothetical protein BIY21_06160 [Vibrio ponticus]